jgi:hypothetical protein
MALAVIPIYGRAWLCTAPSNDRSNALREKYRIIEANI